MGLTMKESIVFAHLAEFTVPHIDRLLGVLSEEMH
uniref:Uncharacterized protein n=1 Tax=Moniliophthora roreri TaxID=221103 RepID=A0A0W0FXU5_MONRR